MKKCINLARLGIAGAAALMAGCATIVNDPMIPLAVNFSDGSMGQCSFENKRGKWETDIPTSNVMIRRSDDALNYECSTVDGREASGAIRSEVEGEKMAASVIFWDLGITDAITDKHRTYQGNLTISVPQQTGDEVSPSGSPDASGGVYTALEKLNELKEKGIITEEEFETEKKRLLNHQP